MTGRLLTVPEAAERLRVTADWLYRLTGRGEIAVTRLGRRVLITEESLDAYIAANTATTRRSRKGAAA